MTTFNATDLKTPKRECASCFKEIKNAAYKIKGKPLYQCETCFLDDEPIEE